MLKMCCKVVIMHVIHDFNRLEYGLNIIITQRDIRKLGLESES